jgi:hypothetical protein
MANAITGLERVFEVAQMLNNIIKATNQPIDINNKQIWGDYLHKFSNEDWDDMLTALEEMRKIEPGAFTAYHNNNMITARQVLDKGQLQGKTRVLDKRETKRYAWAMIMTMRECYNRAAGTPLPNTAGQAPAPAKNNYTQLFGE